MNILVLGLGIGLIVCGILHALPARHRARLWAAMKPALSRLAMILCLLTGSGMLAYDWLWQVTATAPRPGALWRASVADYDIGIDTRPPTVTDAGSVELWIYPHDADDIVRLIRVYGAPALPALPPSAPADDSRPVPTPTPPMRQV